jgi:hypothetical protein
MRPGAEPNRFYSYGVIARLALLAAAHEQHEATQGLRQSIPAAIARV